MQNRSRGGRSLLPAFGRTCTDRPHSPKINGDGRRGTSADSDTGKRSPVEGMYGIGEGDKNTLGAVGEREQMSSRAGIRRVLALTRKGTPRSVTLPSENDRFMIIEAVLEFLMETKVGYVGGKEF